jgi:hypothetical protein
VFWCCGYKQQVSTYVNIKTNKKDNEISYSKFHAWMAFTIVQNQSQIDIDGLFPLQHVVHAFHEQPMTSSHKFGGNS